jgi:hypothetical protein
MAFTNLARSLASADMPAADRFAPCEAMADVIQRIDSEIPTHVAAR